MFTFVRCQCHPKIPTLQCWYLVVEPKIENLAENLSIIDKMHEMTTRKLFLSTCTSIYPNDPKVKENADNPNFHPIKLATGYANAITKWYFAGKTLLFNVTGGWCFLDPSMKVLATIESETMEWPGLIEGEVITIARWPGQRHYYLKSSAERVFTIAKFDTYEDASAHAALFVDEDNILGDQKIKKYVYPTKGD